MPTRQIALTIDDGYDDATLSAYLDLVEHSGVPVTFCPIAKLATTWMQHKSRIRDLIRTDHVQIVNHTFHHLDLTKLSDAAVQTEIESNEAWIEKTFGITSRPYLRPPGGSHDARTDSIAGSLGFTKILLWQGSFGDSALLSKPQLLDNAMSSLWPGAIVLGHANYPTVIPVLPDILQVITERRLTPVTVDTLCGTSRSRGS